MANYEFATSSTKLLQQIISTKVRPSVSSEGRYKYCQRLSLEASRGAGTSCDVFSLGLVGMGGRRTLLKQSSDLKTSDGHKPFTSPSKRHKQLIIPLKAFLSGGGHAFFANEEKKSNQTCRSGCVGQSV